MRLSLAALHVISRVLRDDGGGAQSCGDRPSPGTSLQSLVELCAAEFRAFNVIFEHEQHRSELDVGVVVALKGQ